LRGAVQKITLIIILYGHYLQVPVDNNLADVKGSAKENKRFMVWCVGKFIDL
jgi:hypothetical protein